MSADELAVVTQLAGGHGLERSELVRLALEIVVADPALLRRVEPLRLRRDYTAVGRKTFLVEQLPDGALPIHEKDPEVTTFVVGSSRQPGEEMSATEDEASEGHDGAVRVTFGGVTHTWFIDVPPRKR